jgi:phosphoribosylformylglycinamidine synthase
LISGKDSMKNDVVMDGIKISVPPTLLVSAIGQIDDVRRAITLEPRSAGDIVFLLGTTRGETGGSEYLRWRGHVGNKVPRLDVAETLPLYRRLSEASRRDWVASAATPAMGGWALALARATMAGDGGLELDVSGCEDLLELAPDVALFSESAGRFLITVPDEHADSFERHFDGLACRRVGCVTSEPRLRVRAGRSMWLDLETEPLRRAFKETLEDA